MGYSINKKNGRLARFFIVYYYYRFMNKNVYDIRIVHQVMLT
jgi:hypothetical protein